MAILLYRKLDTFSERPTLANGVFEDSSGWHFVYRKQLIRVDTRTELSSGKHDHACFRSGSPTWYDLSECANDPNVDEILEEEEEEDEEQQEPDGGPDDAVSDCIIFNSLEHPRLLRNARNG